MKDFSIVTTDLTHKYSRNGDEMNGKSLISLFSRDLRQ